MIKRLQIPWLTAVLGILVVLTFHGLARAAAPAVIRPPITVIPPVSKTLGPFTLVPGKVVLDRCTPTADSTPRSMKGSGTLRLTLRSSGQDYTYALSPASFNNLTADGSGQMTGGTVSLNAGQMNDFLGSGLSLAYGFSTVTANGQAPAEFNLQRAQLTTPFNDLAGNPFHLDYTGMKLSIDAQGAVTLTGANGRPRRGNMLTNNGAGLMESAFQAAGLKIAPQDATLDLKSTEANRATFTLTCGSGAVNTSIPKLLLVDGSDLGLAFKNLVVDDHGDVTVKDMDVPTGARQDITLANPANFTLSVTRARVSMESSKFIAFGLQANVTLPPCVTNDDGGQVSMPSLWYDMLADPVIDLTKLGGTLPLRPIEGVRNAAPVVRVAPPPVPQTRTLNFNGYHVVMSDIVIDLSREGPDDPNKLMPGITGKRWQGVFARNADITLPTKVWGANGGQPVTLHTTNCFVDDNGFTGEVNAPANDLSAIEIHGFNPKLKNLHIIFGRNSVLTSECRGTAEVPQFNGQLDLVVKISNTDTSLMVENPSTLENVKLGTIVSVFTGALREGPASKYALWLNGAISLDIPECPALKNSALGFHGLGIDTDGQFVTTDPKGWLNLDAPAQADFGLLHCNVSSLLFAQDTITKKWSVSLNGEYSLNSDLPVSGTLSCTPLRVDEGANAADQPHIAAKEVAIGVDANVFSVARITGSLKILQDAQSGKWNSLRGDANLALLMVGESPPLNNSDGGGHFELFLKEGNVWAAAGSVNMPADTSIPLGTTGLGLYKFMGGIARNMTPKKADFGGVDDLNAAPSANSWLFSAGVGVELIADPDLFHAEGNMTVGLPDFSFNIHGDGWLFVGREAPKPGQVVADVTLNPSVPSFAVDAGVDMKLPSPDVDVLHLTGNLGMLVSPGDVHLDIGWPYPEKAIKGEVLGGVLNVHAGAHLTPLSYQFSAGAGFDYWIFSGSIEGTFGYQFTKQPYLFGHVTASGEVDFYVVSLGCSADLAAEVYADSINLDGTFTASVGMPWPIPDLDVSAHFGVNIGR